MTQTERELGRALLFYAQHAEEMDEIFEADGDVNKLPGILDKQKLTRAVEIASPIIAEAENQANLLTEKAIEEIFKLILLKNKKIERKNPRYWATSTLAIRNRDKKILCGVDVSTDCGVLVARSWIKCGWGVSSQKLKEELEQMPVFIMPEIKNSWDDDALVVAEVNLRDEHFIESILFLLAEPFRSIQKEQWGKLWRIV